MSYDNFADRSTMESFQYRKRGQIAPHLERNVCLCYEIPKFIELEGLWAYVCNECKKPPTYWIFHCVSCDTDFIHDFMLNFCWINPICWDCNFELNESCEDQNHYRCWTWVTPEQIRPPFFELKPAFTEEELKDVFDF